MKFVLKFKSRLKSTAVKRHAFVSLLLATTLVSLTGQTLASRVTLRFKAKITDNAQSLNDVLVITHPRQGLCNLSTLQLNSKPLKGDIITREQVIFWIHQQNNCQDAKIEWLGKTKATIEGKTQTTAAQLTQLAYHALHQRLSQRYRQVTLTPLSTLKPSGLRLEQFTPNLPNEVTRRMQVWLDSPQQSISVWFKVSVKQRVLIARHDLAAKQTLQARDFQLKLSDVTGINHPLTHIKPGYRLKSRLKRGQILTQTNTTPLPAVKTGNTVTVKVKQGLIEVTDHATALNEAFVGDLIWVKNTRSNQRYRAKITAPDTGEAIQ